MKSARAKHKISDRVFNELLTKLHKIVLNYIAKKPS